METRCSDPDVVGATDQTPSAVSAAPATKPAPDAA